MQQCKCNLKNNTVWNWQSQKRKFYLYEVLTGISVKTQRRLLTLVQWGREAGEWEITANLHRISLWSDGIY